MSLRTAYDTWHQRIYEADPSHEDASSPWYQLVREYLGEVAGLCILEVACGRGGFMRQMANAGARVTGVRFFFCSTACRQQQSLPAKRRAACHARSGRRPELALCR